MKAKTLRKMVIGLGIGATIGLVLATTEIVSKELKKKEAIVESKIGSQISKIYWGFDNNKDGNVDEILYQENFNTTFGNFQTMNRTYDSTDSEFDGKYNEMMGAKRIK